MALFIGGQADGRRMEVKYEERRIRLPYIRPMRASVSASESIIGEMHVEEYVLAYKGIYIHESLKERDLLKLLASGYRHEDAGK